MKLALLQLMRKNQYEEALFRAEDDRFELDMVIECGASAIQRMQPLAEHLMALEQDEKASYRLPEGALGPIHFRAVQKIYGRNLTKFVWGNAVLSVNLPTVGLLVNQQQITKASCRLKLQMLTAFNQSGAGQNQDGDLVH